MPSARSVRMTRTAISPRLATRTLRNTNESSHPEDAVADGGERRVARRRQGQPEDPPLVRRVDHPVVPQPRGGVVRVALRLVLVPGGLLERLFLRGLPGATACRNTVPRNTGRGDLVAPHGRE